MIHRKLTTIRKVTVKVTLHGLPQDLLQGRANGKQRPKGPRRVGFLGRVLRAPSYQLGDLGRANGFLYNLWPVSDHGGHDFCPWSLLYMVKSAHYRWLHSKSGGRVRRPHVLLENTSTTTHIYTFVVYRNEVVGIEQSFTVFLHWKTASPPFRLTSEMEFLLRDNTSQLFHGRVSACPPCSCMWASVVISGNNLDNEEIVNNTEHKHLEHEPDRAKPLIQ